MRHFRKVEVESSSLSFGPKPRKHNWTCLCFVIRRLWDRTPHEAPSSKDQAAVVIKAAYFIGNEVDQDRSLTVARRKSDVGIVGPICWQAGVPVDTEI